VDKRNVKHLRMSKDTLCSIPDVRLAAVNLVDAHLCSDPSKYLSALLLSLNTMLHLELPHVNVLSKIDLLEAYGSLAFNLEFYAEVQQPSRLVDAMGNNAFSLRFRKLTRGLCEVRRSAWPRPCAAVWRLCLCGNVSTVWLFRNSILGVYWKE
jgi:Conserved hypothetical ATP binding protein